MQLFGGRKMNLCSEGYYKNRHSCFLIQYHLVLMTKYRHPVIQGELETRLKQYTMDYFKERDLPIQAMECMPDHVHILFDGKPNMNLAEFINAYKSASSRRMRAEYADVSRIQIDPFVCLMIPCLNPDMSDILFSLCPPNHVF